MSITRIYDPSRSSVSACRIRRKRNQVAQENTLPNDSFRDPVQPRAAVSWSSCTLCALVGKPSKKLWGRHSYLPSNGNRERLPYKTGGPFANPWREEKRRGQRIL